MFIKKSNSRIALSTISAVALVLIVIIAMIGTVAIFNIAFTTQQPTKVETMTTTQNLIALNQPPQERYITMT